MSEESVGNPTTEAPRVRSLLTDGVVIAAATAFAYLATFVYEIGYCSNFNIPWGLISPNTSTLLVTAATIGWILFSSSNLLGFTTPLFRRAKRGSFWWGVLGYVSVAAIILFKIYDPTLKQIGTLLLWLFGGVAVGVVVVVVVVYALSMAWTFLLFMWRHILKSKKQSQEIVSKKSETKEQYYFSADEFLENWLPKKVARWILVVAGILFFAFIVGDGSARNQKRFLVAKGPPELVVLRIYGDVVIAATLDRAAKQTLNGLTLYSISENKQIDFTNEKIGPLKAKEQ